MKTKLLVIILQILCTVVVSQNDFLSISVITEFLQSLDTDEYNACMNVHGEDIILYPTFTGLNYSLSVNIQCADHVVTLQNDTDLQYTSRKILHGFKSVIENRVIEEITSDDFYNQCQTILSPDFEIRRNITISINCVLITRKYTLGVDYTLLWIILDDYYEDCRKNRLPDGVIYPIISGHNETFTVDVGCARERYEAYEILFGDKFDIVERNIISTLITKKRMATFLVSYMNKDYLQCISTKGIHVEVYTPELGETSYKVNTDCKPILLESLKYLTSIGVKMKYTYAVVDVFGIIGNIFVFFVFVRYKEMRTIPNVYVISLAIADLLLIITLFPYDIIIETGDGFKAWLTYMGFTYYACPLILTAMSIDRYISIRKCINMSKSGESTRKRNTIIALIIVAVLITIFYGLENFMQTQLTLILNNKDRVIVTTMYVVCIRFVLPLILISTVNVLTSRLLVQSAKDVPGENQAQQTEARTRAARILLGLILNFTICYVFEYATFILLRFLTFHIIVMDHDGFLVSTIMNTIGYLMYGFHSCVNPIILYLNSPAWKKYFTQTIYSQCCRQLCRSKDGEKTEYTA